MASLQTHTEIVNAFEEFRTELDDENDRRERVVKVCIIEGLATHTMNWAV